MNQKFINRWLASLILITIALLQIYLTQTTHLSPWKGGGFGMFAVVDSPSQRVITAEGITATDLRVTLNLEIEPDDYRRMQALPKIADLNAIGQQLLDQAIVPVGIQTQTAIQSLQRENPNLIVSPFLPSGSYPPVYRLRNSQDPATVLSQELKGIRLQWWRVGFNSEKHRLEGKPLTPIVVVGVFPSEFLFDEE